MQDLKTIREEALSAARQAPSSRALYEVKMQYLGRGGAVTALLKGMKDIPPEQRPAFGKQVNDLRAALEAAFEEAEKALSARELGEKLAKEQEDVTMPGRKRAVGTLHPVTRMKNQLIDIFAGMGFEIFEGPEIEKYQKATQEVYNYSVRAEKLMAAMSPVVQVIMYATMIILLSVGGVSIVGGGLRIADLTGLLSYATQILSGVMMVAMVLTFIAMSRPAMERISEILSEESTIKDPADPVFEVRDGAIEFDHVSFAYRKGGEGEDVIKDVSLKIASGETIGIIGQTGSAKTTLVSLIPRLYDATEGSVKVGGRDVKEYDLTALRDAVAMVLQKNVLFSGSVADNLRWGKEDATQEELEFACKQACADEFIEQLPGKYEYDLGQGGVNVSGGQKQRLCIARALLKSPKVLILDDSTSAVDTKTDSRIRAALREHAPDVTKLIIAQRINSVQDADRILVLDEGRVSGFGTHEELLKSNEIYRSIYESQTRGGDDHADAE